MSAPLIARKTNYLKNNVPYYKYYQTESVDTDSQQLFSSATATVGGQNCYTPAYSFKGAGTSSGNFPSSGSGMATSIITPTSQDNKSVTLAVWIKPSQNNLNSRTIWGCHADSTPSGISLGMDDSQAGHIKFHPISYAGVLRSIQTIYANQWYLIVGVYDRENNKMKLYVNGQLDNSISIPSNPIGTAYEVKYLYIWKAGFWSPNGASSPTSSQSASQVFSGNILNCCTWYRALTDSEITQLYNNGNGLQINTSVTPYTDVAIAYPLNEESGGTAYSAINGQSYGIYGYNSSYNLHVSESIFSAAGVKPEAIYTYTGDNWETDLEVSSEDEFSSELSLTRSMVPSKITVTFDNPSPKNPVELVIDGSNDSYNWNYLTTIQISSNTNQTIEENISTSEEYMYYRIYTTEAYLTTGLTINNITIDGYWLERNEVGGHSEWDERIEEGTHTILSNEEDYDTIEHQNEEYEVQNV